MCKIILIESKKIFSDISRGISKESIAIQVDSKSIYSYDNNKSVIAVICSRKLAQIIETINLPNCKLIQLESVGYDDIDVKSFCDRGISICTARSIYDNCLAEYVVFAMLLYAKRFHKSPKKWFIRPFRNYHYMSEIAGKTVGIMGVGQIGSAVAKHLSSFGVKIIGFASKTKEHENFSKIYHIENFHSFLSSCDFLINVLPHNPSTIGLLNNQSLSSLKPNIVFINIGRDSIYNRKDFINFFRTNKEAVAILDIFEVIPRYITNPLRHLSNVLIFPRISAISRESDENLNKLIIDNITRLMNNEQLINQIQL